MAKKFSELLDKMTPERRDMIRRKAEELSREITPLAELRRSGNISQSDLALALGVSRTHISKMEKRADMYISSLRGLIEGMGGELEIVARFPEKEVRRQSFPEQGAELTSFPA